MVTWTDSIYPPYAWNDYYLYDTYLRGGFFFTVELGVKFKVYKRLGLYCSADYSLWSVSGENHYWIYQYVPGEEPGTIKLMTTEICCKGPRIPTCIPDTVRVHFLSDGLPNPSRD